MAEANLKANGLEGRVSCLEAAGFDHPDLQSAAPYDLIFANILKGPLIALAPDLFRHNSDGGFAILSGILNEQADQVVEVYQALGYNLVSRNSIVDWTTLEMILGFSDSAADLDVNLHRDVNVADLTTLVLTDNAP